MIGPTVEIRDKGTQAALVEADQELRFAAETARRRAAQEVARQMKRGAPQAFGTLVQSINAQDLPDGETSRIGPHVIYARMVEEGTGGGAIPPESVIEDWIKVKGIQPRDPTMNVSQLAYAIARSISWKGTRAQPFVQPIIDSGFAEQRLQALVQRNIARVLKKRKAGG